MFSSFDLTLFSMDGEPGFNTETLNFLRHKAGVYILQNTMARGGGRKWCWGKKMKTEAVRKGKGERKKKKR